MAEMLSPGVFTSEIDASTIVPTVSSSIGVFGGDFVKGPVGVQTLITSVADLLTFYGKPTNKNYNDFYQAYNFLQYGNKLLLSRASNINGLGTVVTSSTSVNALAAGAAGTVVVDAGTGSKYAVGDMIAFDVSGGASVDLTHVYLITAIVTDTLTLDRIIDANAGVDLGSAIYTVQRSMNSVYEAISSAGTATPPSDYFKNLQPIENKTDYDMKETSIAFSGTDAKIKFIARNPGAWGNSLEICIATPTLFGATVPTYAFTGIPLDDLFEYAPTGTEIGIVIREGTTIVETWTADFDVTAKDFNNKSTYIETLINNNSTYVYVKDNTANTTAIENYCAQINNVNGSTLSLFDGTDSPIQADDLLNAYAIWDNKEFLDIDIVIANELDNGVSAKNLVDTRQDCIGFIGANYADVVGKKSAVATANLVTWRKTGAINYNNMFLVASGNYKYQYDRYNDRYRWVNIAGDISGLRAQTSSNRASWWASAGLERGQIKGVTKLAFSPTQGQRDILYKNGINPIVAFPGQGTVMWGF